MYAYKSIFKSCYAQIKFSFESIRSIRTKKSFHYTIHKKIESNKIIWEKNFFDKIQLHSHNLTSKSLVKLELSLTFPPTCHDIYSGYGPNNYPHLLCWINLEYSLERLFILPTNFSHDFTRNKGKIIGKKKVLTKHIHIHIELW